MPGAPVALAHERWYLAVSALPEADMLRPLIELVVFITSLAFVDCDTRISYDVKQSNEGTGILIIDLLRHHIALCILHLYNILPSTLFLLFIPLNLVP